MMVSSKERSDKRAKHQTSCVVGSSGGNISKKVIGRAPPFLKRLRECPSVEDAV